MPKNRLGHGRNLALSSLSGLFYSLLAWLGLVPTGRFPGLAPLACSLVTFGIFTLADRRTSPPANSAP